MSCVCTDNVAATSEMTDQAFRNPHATLLLISRSQLKWQSARCLNVYCIPVGVSVLYTDDFAEHIRGLSVKLCSLGFFCRTNLSVDYLKQTTCYFQGEITEVRVTLHKMNFL